MLNKTSPPFSQLMVQGTTSDAGKSTLVTALGRYYKYQGYCVAPFKPQNMSLNSAVTCDGGEIGRAQAVQAQACGLEPHSDMNPILLKPHHDTQAQVIIHGKVLNNQSAQAYHDYKKIAWQAVEQSWQRLRTKYDMLLVEGAGSPAEINLREGDIANMGFAERVDCPVLLIADIDRGGVFAHLVGTLALLTPSEQARVVGFVINRFRGDKTLLDPGLEWLEKKTGKPVLGVLPYLSNLYLEAEDALSMRQHHLLQHEKPRFTIVVVCYPGLSNHTDFDALQLHPEVLVKFARCPHDVDSADLIILPGSKSVRADLYYLIQQGWQTFILRHLRYGGKVLGICGGFQMLGKTIADPHGIESVAGCSLGLGLLDMDTELNATKCLRKQHGYCYDGVSEVSGYEIHLGISQGPALQKPLLLLDCGADGARSDDDQIAGTYLHGVFDEVSACQALLAWAGYLSKQCLDLSAQREQGFDSLANTLKAHFDFDTLHRLLK